MLCPARFPHHGQRGRGEKSENWTLVVSDKASHFSPLDAHLWGSKSSSHPEVARELGHWTPDRRWLRGYHSERAAEKTFPVNPSCHRRAAHLFHSQKGLAKLTERKEEGDLEGPWGYDEMVSRRNTDVRVDARPRIPFHGAHDIMEAQPRVWMRGGGEGEGDKRKPKLMKFNPKMLKITRTFLSSGKNVGSKERSS